MTPEPTGPDQTASGLPLEAAQPAAKTDVDKWGDLPMGAPAAEPPDDCDLSDSQWRGVYWKGVAASSSVALVMSLFLIRLLAELGQMSRTNAEDGATILGFSMFLGIPMAMGVVAQWVWQPLKLRAKKIGGHTFVLTIFGLLGAAVAFHEGAICLAMASLLIWLLVYIGYWLGYWLCSIHNRSVYGSLIPLAVVMIWADMAGTSGLSRVQDKIVIRATPQQIWPYLLNTPAIAKPSGYWLTRMGLPEPRRTETRGTGVGADRLMWLTHDEVVKEKITRWEPGAHLAVRMTQQPKHPEIAGHLDLLRGNLDMVDNGDGTTTLVSSLWYDLHVQPLAYFRVFANDAIRNTHWTMLAHIKALAEAKSAAKVR